MAKEKAPKPDDAEEVILNYLRTQNRPYSANDISVNLRGSVSKLIATRVCNQLVEKGSVVQKTYGKAMIYVIKQDDVVVSTEEIEEMEEKIQNLKEHVADLKATNRDLSTRYTNIANSISTNDARAKAEYLRSENAKLSTRLNADRVVIPLSEREKIEKEHSYMQKLHRERKRIALDILGMICESGPKKEDLAEELGMELE